MGVQKITSLLKPPVFEDSEKTRIAGLLHIMLLIIFLASAGLPIYGFITNPGPDLGRMVSIVLALSIFYLLVQVHRGHIRLASILLPTAILLAVTSTVMSVSGLRDADITGYFVLIAVASMLLGARGTVVFGGLSMLSAMVAYFMETNHLITIPPPVPINLTNLITLLTTMSLMTVLLRFAVQRIREGFDQANLHADSLARSNQELQAMRDSLALRVEERTQELSEALDSLKLTQIELLGAKETAEKANQAKSIFLSNMSHELRTPLNGILGFSQILAYDPTISGKQAEALDVIQRSGEHLLTLIEDVLDITKIEAGKVEIFAHELYLPSLLHEVVSLMRLQAEEKGLEFIYEPAADLPKNIISDEKRLRQILLNLLNNAMKFTHEGSVTLRVFKREDGLLVHNSVRICFEVIDTGVGISDDEMKTIFLPFVQAGDNWSRAEGVGLGLTICRQLAEIMGGTIYVQSNLGEGSCFGFDGMFTFTEGFAIAEMDEKRPIVDYTGSLQTALIVDDNAHNRLVLTTLLEPIGFAIVEAENGKDAVSLAQEIRPQVIIMDAVMPLMNGMEATRRIRQIPELQDVLIIAVSAGAYEATRTDCMAAGSNAFLPKPFQVEELLDLLEEHLPIEWIYDREDVAEDHQMVLPYEDVLRDLYNLAVIGDYFAMKSKVEMLAQETPALVPFVYRLCGMIDQFDDGLIDFLKSVWLD